MANSLVSDSASQALNKSLSASPRVSLQTYLRNCEEPSKVTLIGGSVFLQLPGDAEYFDSCSIQDLKQSANRELCLWFFVDENGLLLSVLQSLATLKEILIEWVNYELVRHVVLASVCSWPSPM